jgi:hypothetical protein
MPSLKQIFEEMDIDISDIKLEEEEEKPELDLEKIPEDQREVVSNMMEQYKNDIAAKDLTIQTMNQMIEKTKPKEEHKVEEKEEEEDPYLKEIRSLREEITSLRNERHQNTEEKFMDDVRSFAKDNPDIVRYATDMDNLRKNLRPDSPLMYDVQSLYSFVKKEKGGEKKFQTERSGVSARNTQKIQQANSMAEAFENAESSLGKTGT